jgi:hypothetical protein
MSNENRQTYTDEQLTAIQVSVMEIGKRLGEAKQKLDEQIAEYAKAVLSRFQETGSFASVPLMSDTHRAYNSAPELEEQVKIGGVVLPLDEEVEDAFIERYLAESGAETPAERVLAAVDAHVAFGLWLAKKIAEGAEGA